MRCHVQYARQMAERQKVRNGGNQLLQSGNNLEDLSYKGAALPKTPISTLESTYPQHGCHRDEVETNRNPTLLCLSVLDGVSEVPQPHHSRRQQDSLLARGMRTNSPFILEIGLPSHILEEPTEKPAGLPHLDGGSRWPRPPRGPPLHLMGQTLGHKSPLPLPLWSLELWWRKSLGHKEVNDFNKRNFFVLCKSQHMICY
ncbi:PREDICTED: uncharacterized protein LOC108518631 [Rhinopithecus bieti]|uniref:uncharacterized protein LOC108518631 n=1 Tax=Rhinopithecus bieti TaxID=61621 RepID=UPI00083C1C9F|nr:PREDICTED: uncharacterized protein LOC108518631 [Rhinopithecus bieti]